MLGRREASRFDLDPLRVAGASRLHITAVQAVMLAVLAAAALAPLALAALWRTDQHAGLAAWWLVTAAVQVVFGWIGLAVGLAGGARRGVLAAVLLFWVLVSLVAPRWMLTVAQAAAPTSRLAYDTALAAALARSVDGHGHNEANERFKQDLLRQYGVADLKQLPVNADAMLMQADEDARALAFAAETERLRAAFDAQDRTVDALRWLNPLVAYERIGTALTHTDRHTLQVHADAVERHRLQLVRALNEDMARHTRTGDWKTPAARELFAALPPAPALPIDTGAALVRSAPSIAALTLWMALAAGALLVAARRAAARAS